jgi:hypothetical protein
MQALRKALGFSVTLVLVVSVSACTDAGAGRTEDASVEDSVFTLSDMQSVELTYWGSAGGGAYSTRVHLSAAEGPVEADESATDSAPAPAGVAFWLSDASDSVGLDTGRYVLHNPLASRAVSNAEIRARQTGGSSGYVASVMPQDSSEAIDTSNDAAAYFRVVRGTVDVERRGNEYTFTWTFHGSSGRSFSGRTQGAVDRAFDLSPLSVEFLPATE